MLIDALIVSLAGSFVVSAVERWIDLSWLRGVLALAVAAVAVFTFDYRGTEALWLSMASAFGTLLMVLVGERLASPPPMVLDRRSTVI